jgi:hypothetical protein
MAATTFTTPTTAPRAARRAQLLRTGAAYGLVASAATAAAAALAHGAGVPLTIDGEAIPALGFAQLTFMFVLVGAGIAKACSMWSSRPRHTFVVTTVVLAALSVVPDIVVNASTATKVTLALTHVVAALIAIPALASRLSD